jgi:transposase
VRRLHRAGVGEIAIERGDGQVVDALLGAGLTVVVISPNQVHSLRGRYGSAGNKDDRFDAFVLADTLRTDRARLRPLIPDTPATVMLRSAVRARKDLLAHRVGLANQLRAHLEFFHPGPVGLFADLDGVTSLRFLTRFTCSPRPGSRPGCATSPTPAARTPPRCTPACSPPRPERPARPAPRPLR